MKFNLKSLPKRIFSPSKAIAMTISYNIGTDLFSIGAVVADRGSFCYYKLGQQPLQFGTVFVIKNWGSGYYKSEQIYYKSLRNSFDLVAKVKKFWFLGL